MRFRLFRSRAFWFGVPGLVFLLWGWWDSMGHFSALGTSGVGLWGTGHSEGEIFVVWQSDRWPEWRTFDSVHVEMPVGAGDEWRMVLAAGHASDPAFRYVLMAYYWPVLGYVAVWAGLIFWRSRKYRAFAKAE